MQRAYQLVFWYPFKLTPPPPCFSHKITFYVMQSVRIHLLAKEQSVVIRGLKKIVLNANSVYYFLQF